MNSLTHTDAYIPRKQALSWVYGVFDAGSRRWLKIASFEFCYWKLYSPKYMKTSKPFWQKKNTISKTIEQKAWAAPIAAGLDAGVAKTAFLWIINFLSSHHRPKCKGRPEEGKEVLVKFDGHLIYANRMREMKLGKGKSKQTKIKIWNRKLALLSQTARLNCKTNKRLRPSFFVKSRLYFY